MDTTSVLRPQIPSAERCVCLYMVLNTCTTYVILYQSEWKQVVFSCVFNVPETVKGFTLSCCCCVNTSDNRSLFEKETLNLFAVFVRKHLFFLNIKLIFVNKNYNVCRFPYVSFHRYGF